MRNTGESRRSIAAVALVSSSSNSSSSSSIVVVAMWMLSLLTGQKVVQAFAVPRTWSCSSSSCSSSSSALFMTHVKRNEHVEKLAGSYLFPEIACRRNAFEEAHPELADRIISLGVGDTTQPIPSHIVSGLVEGAKKLGTPEGYSGYGAEQGNAALREKIASVLYNNRISPEEVFVSDGAQGDILRVQQMFGSQVTSAVQDPSYPAYVETSVMMGQTGPQNPNTAQYGGIVYMPCTAENNFFPNLAELPRADVVYFCNPNNPTGAAATREQLTQLVLTCRERGSILVYDAAYAAFIRTPGVPKTIYEIEGATEVAIEVNSFSKFAGFTGVRLGWTIVPSALTYEDGSSVRNDYNRVMTTTFNGASNIAQGGGLACLDPEGLAEIKVLIDYYMENAALLRSIIGGLDGYEVYGGTDAPYVFVKLPEGMKSWDAFSDILEKAQVVTIPGAGFGPGGEGYLRLSAFAPRDAIEEAGKRITKALKRTKEVRQRGRQEQRRGDIEKGEAAVFVFGNGHNGNATHQGENMKERATTRRKTLANVN